MGLSPTTLSSALGRDQCMIWEQIGRHDYRYAMIVAGLFKAISVTYAGLIPERLLNVLYVGGAGGGDPSTLDKFEAMRDLITVGYSP